MTLFVHNFKVFFNYKVKEMILPDPFWRAFVPHLHSRHWRTKDAWWHGVRSSLPSEAYDFFKISFFSLKQDIFHAQPFFKVSEIFHFVKTYLVYFSSQRLAFLLFWLLFYRKFFINRFITSIISFPKNKLIEHISHFKNINA